MKKKMLKVLGVEDTQSEVLQVRKQKGSET